MISLETARQLKEAGLLWQAGQYDFFAIPDRDLDDRIFVITDVMAYLGLLKGWPVVMFHGSAEWALDYILTSELIWLPTEEQLREALLQQLPDKTQQTLHLWFADNAYQCQVYIQGDLSSFTAPTASDAYALALLSVLHHEK
jgi:hypothetical protein